MEPIARYLDAAILKPDMTPEQVDKAIDECIALETMTVCVRGCDIDRALKKCAGTETKVSCVLDFPYGYSGAAAKRAIARDYAARGVYEIDMVMNYGAARGGDWATVETEIRGVVEEAHAKNVGVKVIFETSQLDAEQIRRATEVSIAAGADFVKTSPASTARARRRRPCASCWTRRRAGRRSSPPAASAILPPRRSTWKWARRVWAWAIPAAA